MIDNTERLKNLQAWKIKKEIEENAKQLAEEERQARVLNEIEGLWERAQAIIDLYNAGIEAGLTYPKEDFYTTARAFESNSWSHWLGVGFYGDCRIKNGKKLANAISIRGGGACYYEIDLYNGHLYYSGSHAWYRLNDFVADFNKFEKYFYETWDKLTA